MMERLKFLVTAMRPSRNERLAKFLFALALTAVAVLGFVEIIGSPGAIARCHLVAAPSIPLDKTPNVSEVLPQKPVVLVPVRPTLTVDRQPLDEALRDLRAAKPSLDAALQTLVSGAHEKLDVDLLSQPREVLDKNASLARVVRGQPTGKQSWNTVQDAFKKARVASADASVVLVKAESTTLTFESLDEFEALVRNVKMATEKLDAVRPAIDNAKKDVEHLGVLLAADRFEQKLRH